MAKLLFSTLFLVLLSSVFSESCKNPQVTSKSFTTQDATIVTNIAYISEFSVKCDSGSPSSLYVELDGNVVPASSVGTDTYQVSWTEDADTARRGDKELSVYDEDGYATLKKAIRNGEEVSSVPALFSVVVSHPGAYNGPWFNSEFVATVISVVVAYVAIASRSKITARN